MAQTQGALERARFLLDLVKGAITLLAETDTSDEDRADTTKRLDAAYHAFFGREAAVHVRNAFIHAVANGARVAARGPSLADQMLAATQPDDGTRKRFAARHPETAARWWATLHAGASTARELFAVLYPEAAAKLDEAKLRAAVDAWQADHGKWEAVREAIKCFEPDPPQNIERMWRLDPRSWDVRDRRKA